MIRYTAGEILLAELPFTSGTSRKIRPVLVVLDTGDEDVMVAPVTTSPATTPGSVAVSDFREAGLVKPSVVRLHKIATIHKSRTLSRLGQLSPSDFSRAARLWRQVFAAWEAG